MSNRENDNKAVRLIKMLEREGVKHEHITYLLNCHFPFTTYHSVIRDGKSNFYRVNELPGIENALIYGSEVVNV